MALSMKSLARVLSALGFLAAGAQPTHNLYAQTTPSDGQRIAFLGDSITQGGWGNPGGYVRLVLAGLEANGIKAVPIPAGIGGHKSNQMLERLGRDVLSHKPDWMTLSCGVNDVWHGVHGVPLPQYKTNIAAIVDRCHDAGVKVMILTSTVIGEELDNENNALLAPYNEFLRQLAAEKKCLLADLSALFHQALKAGPKTGRVLTSDGVHMNPAGDQLMAKGVLRAFGLDEDRLKKAEEAWQDLPGAATLQGSFAAGKGKVLRGTRGVTLRQRQQLSALAAARNQSLDTLLNDLYAAEARTLLKPSGQYESFEEIFRDKQEAACQARLQEQFGRRIDELLKQP